MEKQYYLVRPRDIVRNRFYSQKEIKKHLYTDYEHLLITDGIDYKSVSLEEENRIKEWVFRSFDNPFDTKYVSCLPIFIVLEKNGKGYKEILTGMEINFAYNPYAICGGSGVFFRALGTFENMNEIRDETLNDILKPTDEAGVGRTYGNLSDEQIRDLIRRLNQFAEQAEIVNNTIIQRHLNKIDRLNEQQKNDIETGKKFIKKYIK